MGASCNAGARSLGGAEGDERDQDQDGPEPNATHHGAMVKARCRTNQALAHRRRAILGPSWRRGTAGACHHAEAL